MKYALLTGAVAALLSFSVSAGEGKTPHEKMFMQLDADGNGVISKQEAGANKELMQAWKKLDKDTSGGLEKSEFAAFEPSKSFTPVEGENEPIGAAPTD